MTLISARDLSLVVVATCLVLWLYLRHKFSYWKERGVPYEKPHTLFGNMKDVFLLRKTESQVMDRLYKEFKGHPYFGVYYLWRPVLVVADTDLIKAVMVTDFDCFPNHQRLSNLREGSTDAVVRSLFVLRDREWRLRRTRFAKCFTPRRLRAMYSAVTDNSARMAALLERRKEDGMGEVELESIFQGYAVDVISSALYGLRTVALDDANSEFLKCGSLVASPPLSSILKTYLYLVAPGLGEALGLATFHPRAFGFFSGVVNRLIQYRKAEGAQGEDLLATMMKMKDADDSEMSFEEMVGHVFSFFQAGYDTTTLTASYAVYELSRNSDVQEELRREVRQAVTQAGGTLNFEAVQNMPYMDQVIAETLRKYPPVGVLKRECVADYMVGGKLAIGRGMLVAIPASSIHMDEEHFPEPESFMPQRFDPQHGTGFNYMPFGKGPRICIGMKLAELEIKTAVALLVSRYSIGPSPKSPHPARVDPRAIFITCRPLDGLWVDVKPLDHPAC